MRNRYKIIIISYPHFAQHLASILNNSHFQVIGITNWSSLSIIQRYRLIRTVDLVHFFYTFLNPFNQLLCKLTGTSCILHYIGTDVVVASRSRWNRFISRFNTQLSQSVLCVSPGLSAELGQIGIFAKTLLYSAPNLNINSLYPPMPVTLTILVYLPKERESFYGLDIVKKLIHNNEDINFILLMNDGSSIGPKHNVEYLPRSNDMQNIYAKTSLLLRMSIHDGFPSMVVEALSFGRQVIRNYPTPFCHHATGLDDVQEIIDQFKLKCPVNYEGANYARKYFSEETLVPKYHQLYLKYL